MVFSPQVNYTDQSNTVACELGADFLGKGCCVVSTMDPYGVNLCCLDQKQKYLIIKIVYTWRLNAMRS
jgi:hypothetical protein